VTLRARRILVIAVIIATAALVGWLVNSESSPFHQYFLYHVTWPNLVSRVNLPAFFIAAVLSGNIHAPEDWAMWVGFVAQWLPLSYLMSRLLVRRTTDVHA
jgi:hypothetical protein